MSDRRSPSEAVVAVEKIEQKIETKSSILEAVGRWATGIIASGVVTFVVVVWQLTQAMSIQTHKLDALIDVVNEMRAEVKANDDRYFSKAEGKDHEIRLRALEAKRK